MRISVRGLSLWIFILLALLTVAFWTLSLGLQFEREQSDRYLQQIEAWQAAIQTAQAEQLLWLQSRFYDMRAGVRVVPTNTQREAYLKQYRQNDESIRWAGLIHLIERNEQQSDCERLAQSLYSETDQGATPVFFSCLHDQQPMMGVRGDFRIYGRDTGLVLMMDYFAFLPQFERTSGLSLQAAGVANGTPRFAPAKLPTSRFFDHEINFNRGEVMLGSLVLPVVEQDFVAYWLDRSAWLLPVGALLLLAWWMLARGLIKPLEVLVKHLQPVILARRPGLDQAGTTLQPGLKLLQRYFILLTHLTRQDPLTGLYNRVIFEERMQQALNDSRRNGRKYALVLIGLIGFHHVNKDAGHFMGDALLRQLAGRLSGNLRETDSIARLGQDSFALLLEHGENDHMGSLLDKVYQSLSGGYRVYERNIEVDISMGVAIYPDHAQDIDGLMLRADEAMMHAQEQGGGVVYAQGTELQADHASLSRMQSFRQALNNREFKLVFQPVVDLKQHRTAYFEALLRWKEPGKGQLSIPQIIELAESSDAISQLSRWIIDSVAAELAHLQDPALKIAVNLSMVDFHDDKLPRHIEKILQAYGLNPQQLMIEITEGQIMRDKRRVVGILNKLSAMGFSLSIDDFGTGQASLAYLRNLPVEKIKIDQSFVRELVSEKDDQSIVQSTIELAHRLQLEVVAEGVESAEIHDLLGQMGCDYAQGYYISKPMEADQVPRWLEQRLTA